MEIICRIFVKNKRSTYITTLILALVSLTTFQFITFSITKKFIVFFKLATLNV